MALQLGYKSTSDALRGWPINQVAIMDWHGTQNNFNTAAFAKYDMRVIFDKLDMTRGIVWGWRRSAVESVEHNYPNRDMEKGRGEIEGRGEPGGWVDPDG